MPHYLHFEVILNNPKSLMTLMTVTLMTGFRDWKMKMTLIDMPLNDPFQNEIKTAAPSF